MPSFGSWQIRVVQATRHTGPSSDRPRIRFSDERYFAPTEIAEILGYRNDEAIRKAIRCGRLRAVQTSTRRILIPESAVEEWLASCVVEPVPEVGAAATSSAEAQARAVAGEARILRKRDVPILGGAVVRS